MGFTPDISDKWRYEGAPGVAINPPRLFGVDDTVALWRFDEPEGSHRFEDATANGHTLFLGGVLPVQPAGLSTLTWGRLKAVR